MKLLVVKKNDEVLKSKARIIERTNPVGMKTYVIQVRHWLFRWQWVDAWVNSWLGASCQDSFFSLEEAQKHIPMFDGTDYKEQVIQYSPK